MRVWSGVVVVFVVVVCFGCSTQSQVTHTPVHYIHVLMLCHAMLCCLLSLCTVVGVRFLEGLVKRLSEELAVRMGGSGGASSLSPGAATVHAGSHSAAAGGSDVPLPPWMKDSRCVCVCLLLVMRLL